MRHLVCVSRRPGRAQSTLCTNIGNDYQALLCFLLEALQTVFPSFADSKTPTQTES
jgi:hypothetical protein